MSRPRKAGVARQQWPRGTRIEAPTSSRDARRLNSQDRPRNGGRRDVVKRSRWLTRVRFAFSAGGGAGFDYPACELTRRACASDRASAGEEFVANAMHRRGPRIFASPDSGLRPTIAPSAMQLSMSTRRARQAAFGAMRAAYLDFLAHDGIPRCAVLRAITPIDVNVIRPRPRCAFGSGTRCDSWSARSSRPVGALHRGSDSNATRRSIYSAGGATGRIGDLRRPRMDARLSPTLRPSSRGKLREGAQASFTPVRRRRHQRQTAAILRKTWTALGAARAQLTDLYRRADRADCDRRSHRA